MMSNILELKNLSKEFKGFRLNDISFHLEKGFIMGLIGPNGAGKSTIIKLIMNLIKRDEGEIKVFGLDNLKDEQKIKESIGFVYDENYFYEDLTIDQMKGIIAPFYHQWDNNTFNKYLKQFDLPLKRKIKDLSKGMKMKFSLLIALSHNPELIIMDEPTSGIDPIFRNELLEILQDVMQDENKGILFSTHITTDLDRIADHITFINQGTLIFSDSKEVLMEHYGLVKGAKELLDWELKKEFVSIKENSFNFEALTKDIAKTRKIFKDSVVIERPSLEDIMLYTVRGSINA